MAFNHTVTYTTQTPSGVSSVSNTYTGSSITSIDETVAHGATNFQINVAIDVSTIKSIFILSDQNVTLETNSGSSPAETISLVANVPYVWHTNSYFTNLLATDITAIFITNASGSTAAITLRVLQDATP